MSGDKNERYASAVEFARALLDGSGFGAILLDPDYRILWVNQKYLQFVGLQLHQLERRDKRELLHGELGRVFGDHSESLANTLLAAYGKGENIEQLECTVYPGADRSSERTLLLTSHILDSGPLKGGRIEYLADISLRKEAERALAQSEAEWRAIVTYSPDFIVRTNLEGKILFINRTLEVFTPGDLIGTSVFEWYSTADQEVMRRAFKHVIETGEPTSYEVTFVQNDGAAIIFETSIGPIRRDGGIAELLLSARDATDRRHAERLLTSTHERAQRYLDIARTILLALDVNGNITLINRKGCEVVQYRREELLGKNWFDLLIPERIRPVLKSRFAELVSGSGPLTREYKNEITRKDGEERTVMWDNAVIRDDDGSIIGTLSSGEDVTERERATRELLNVKGRLDYMLASSPAVIYSCGPAPDYPTTFISDNIEARFGLKPQDFYDDPFFWTKNIHPDDRDRILDILSRIRNAEPLSYEYRFRHRDGHYVWLHDEIAPQVDAEGKITGLVGSWLDITENQKAREDLRESERALHTLMSNLPGMAYRCDCDRDWTMRIVSEGCKKLTGYDVDELLHNVIAYNDLIHPDDQQPVFEQVTAAVEEDRPFQLVYRITTKDGATKWVWEQGRAVPSAPGGPTVLEGFIADITERKKTDDMLRATTEQLRKESAELEEKNIALKQVLEHLERDRQTYRQRFGQELGNAFRPALAKLKQRVAPQCRDEVAALERHIETLLDKDSNHFRESLARLTPREIEICDLIKDGLPSKEIATRLNLSLLTVHKHREQIREKLGLTNRGINLSTYLRMPE